jgi:hypothetical protein
MDILQTIGITAAPPADPKKFEDQKIVTQQTSLVRSQLRSLLSSVDFATQVATVAGLPTTGLESLQKDIAATASSVTLSPADLEKKRAEYEATFEKTRGEQEAAIRAGEVTKLRAVVDKIKKRDTEISAESGLSAETKARSKKLLEDAEYALKVAMAPPVVTAKEGFQTAPAPAAPAAAPAALSASELERQYTVLDLDVAGELEKVFNWRRMLKRTFYSTATYIFYLLLAIGVLLGGILCSNLYASESFWAIRLYYFVYGAAFFPLVLFYSMFKPPFMHSYIFPAYERIASALSGAATDQAAPSEVEVREAEPAAPGPATAAAAAAKGAAASAAAALKAKLPFFGGGEAKDQENTPLLESEGPAATPAGPTFFESLFSFERLDAMATEAKLGGTKKFSRGASIVYVLVSGAYAVFYLGWNTFVGLGS